MTASLNRRKATTFPGSTRLGHKDPGGRTEGRKPSYFVVAPTSRRNPAESSARSFQRRSLPFILANWYSNNTGSSSHRHDRSFKLVRYHYDALSGPGHLSELRVILQSPRPPSDKDHFTTCVSISRLVGRFGRARPHCRLRPPRPLLKGGALLIRFPIAPDVNGVDG